MHGNSTSYCCERCDYDECSACHSRRHFHPHRLEFMPKTFFCDVCRLRDKSFSFGCLQCDYDECVNCFSLSHPSGNHIHALRMTWRQCFTCDSCRQTLGPSNSFCCAACDYDECATCFSKNSQTPVAPASAPVVRPSPPRPALPSRPPMPSVTVGRPHAHPLSRVPRTYICNICRQHKAQMTAFNCSTCDYDECPACFEDSASILSPSCGHCRTSLRLMLNPYSTGFFVCNVCNKTLPGQTYHCMRDNWDVCMSCASSTR
jgi:hypothetical protein